MSACDFCKQDMRTAESCIEHTIHPFGRPNGVAPVLYGDDRESWKDYDITPADRCQDCGVKLGAIHHPGCAREICPVCVPTSKTKRRVQAIACDHAEDRRPLLV